jgi:hypothetical protein
MTKTTKQTTSDFEATMLNMLKGWSDVTPSQRAEVMRLIAISKASR